MRPHRLRIARASIALVLAACAPTADPAAGDRAATAATAATAARDEGRNDALRDSLVAMGRVDQQVRAGMTPDSTRSDAFMRRMAATDSQNTAALAAIVRAHGWPTQAMVGDTALAAAWMVAIHSPWVEFQREVLAQAERVPREGQDLQSMALLTDKILVAEGKPQRYGTQMDFVGSRLVLKPVEDSANLDARRAEMGLPPMAEYVRLMQRFYKADST